MNLYKFVDSERLTYPVQLLCRVVGVAPSRHYAWRHRTAAPPVTLTPAPAGGGWEKALVQTFGTHKRRYGTRRLRVELQAQGHSVGRHRLRTAMRRHRLRAIQLRA